MKKITIIVTLIISLNSFADFMTFQPIQRLPVGSKLVLQALIYLQAGVINHYLVTSSESGISCFLKTTESSTDTRFITNEVATDAERYDLEVSALPSSTFDSARNLYYYEVPLVGDDFESITCRTQKENLTINEFSKEIKKYFTLEIAPPKPIVPGE